MEGGEQGPERGGLGKRVIGALRERFAITGEPDKRPPRFGYGYSSESLSPIFKLPLSAQSTALKTVYDALGHRVLREIEQGPMHTILPLSGEECESMRRFYSDRFAAAIEQNEALKTAAMLQIEQRWNAYNQAYREKLGEDFGAQGTPHDYEPQTGIFYERLDPALFSSGVREHSDLVYAILQTELPYDPENPSERWGVLKLSSLSHTDLDYNRHFKRYLSSDVLSAMMRR